MSSTHLLLLKLVLLFFWSAWFGVVFLTNLFGGLKSGFGCGSRAPTSSRHA